MHMRGGPGPTPPASGRALSGPVRDPRRLPRPGRLARRPRLPRGHAAPRLRLLDRQAGPPAQADRPHLRRRLPQRLHRRAAHAPRTPLARRPRPRGAEPPAGVGHEARDGAQADRRRLGGRRAHAHAPRPDDRRPDRAPARGRGLPCRDPADVPPAGRLLLLPLRPLRRRRDRRRPRGRLPRCDDDERGPRATRLALHARPRAGGRKRRRQRPRREARGAGARMRKLLFAAVALLVLAGGAAAGYVLYKKHESRNIRGSASVEFVTTEKAPKRTPAELRQVPWPTYG